VSEIATGACATESKSLTRLIGGRAIRQMAIQENEVGQEPAKKEFTISCLHEKGSMVTFAQF
jgi:hypothetical protein